jgi:hypothetical protein
VSTEPEPAGEPAPVADRWPTAEENALHEFERYPGLLPGAATHLAKGYARVIGQLPPDRRAESVARVIASPSVARYLDPEYKEPALKGGQAMMSPVRAALSRYLPELKAGALDELVKGWSTELVHHSPERLAGEIVRRLGKPENAKYITRPIDRSFAPRPTAPGPKKRNRSTF